MQLHFESIHELEILSVERGVSPEPSPQLKVAISNKSVRMQRDAGILAFRQLISYIGYCIFFNVRAQNGHLSFTSGLKYDHYRAPSLRF